MEDYTALFNNVSAQIDIITGAPKKFIEEVIKLETISDNIEVAKEAISYLIENKGIDNINFDVLNRYLVDPNSCPISTWRQLYLLAKSIMVRKDAHKVSWVDRLKIFVDTYSLEHAVNGKTLAELPGKILFTRASGDHENLHVGFGTHAADFYCWDKEKNKRHAWVEFKHWGSTNIENAKEYYKDKRYEARYVLVFLSDHTYKLIDYDTNTIIEQPDLAVPEDLLIW